MANLREAEGACTGENLIGASKLLVMSFLLANDTYTHYPGYSGVKNPPARQKTWAQSLGWEDPLEKEMATHSNTLAWEIPWTEEPGGLQPMGSQKSQTRLRN